MLLKRVFDHTDPTKPKLDHIKVLRAGSKQRFSTGLVAAGAKEGWLTLGGGKITLTTRPPVSYRIVRTPGIYCCHDGKEMGDQLEARAYIAAHFAGVPSPDGENPAGYTVINYYDCVKE